MTSLLLLESVEGGQHVARYSFLGKDPFLVLRATADGTSNERSSASRRSSSLLRPRRLAPAISCVSARRPSTLSFYLRAASTKGPRYHVANRKLMMSPSATTYSLPSRRTSPWSRQAAIEPRVTSGS